MYFLDYYIQIWNFTVEPAIYIYIKGNAYDTFFRQLQLISEELDVGNP